ncbi:nuclear transport factor 2 family protein [Neptunicoccus sediminis]|uniref:nuclear transport factor 2 family protein n=1 Tax=Neptunicoccus sediminis TaxID=1892596 RepID=UPI0008461328|nr:nuclear transport factor 2 family protein [Neptunicoccus sediminis]
MKDVISSPTQSALNSLFDAFNAHDPESVSAHFTADAVFDRHAGTAPHGDRHTGPEAIARAMGDTFSAMPDAHWAVLGHWDCAPGLSVSHWVFTGTASTGQHTLCEGLDLYTFEGGLISRKNAFRKQTN